MRVFRLGCSRAEYTLNFCISARSCKLAQSTDQRTLIELLPRGIYAATVGTGINQGKLLSQRARLNP